MKGNKSNCKKIHRGKYYYRGFTLRNHGYYPPDRCVWWEAVNLETNCADFHAHTKGELICLIDNELEKTNKIIQDLKQ